MANKKMNLTDLQEVRKRWKDIPLEVVPKDKVELFKNRKQAVNMYIDGFALKEIEEETGIYVSRIFPLVKRCMQFDADGNFYGYTALLPGLRCYNQKDSNTKISIQVKIEYRIIIHGWD